MIEWRKKDTKLTGTGEATATIIVKVDGELLTTGTADEKEAFTLDHSPQETGTVLTVTQTVNNQESGPTSVTVQDAGELKIKMISDFDFGTQKLANSSISLSNLSIQNADEENNQLTPAEGTIELSMNPQTIVRACDTAGLGTWRISSGDANGAVTDGVTL